jgi:autoinducer 2-degrading protein
VAGGKIMVIVHVFIKIKPDMLEPFKAATLKNAQNSIKEPGILRFDFLQQEDEPLNFLLVEVYKDSNAVARHKETAHYAEWRKCAEHMISEPRKRIKYVNIFPEDKKY